MYRLAVVLIILSLSGSKAAEPEQKWSFLAGDAHNEETGSEVLKGTQLESADKLLKKAMGSVEYLAASNLLPSTKGELRAVGGILRGFARLESIKKSIEIDQIHCQREDLRVLIQFEELLDKDLGGRLKEIYEDMDLFIVERSSRIAEKYLTYCLPKIKEEFETKSNHPKFKEAFDLMHLFETFIDRKKEAQRIGSYLFCNDEIQTFELAYYKRLVKKIIDEKDPLIFQDDSNYFDKREILQTLFEKTCDNREFQELKEDLKFIMSAKRSVKFNWKWISMFNCGERMGLFQLCKNASKKFYRPGMYPSPRDFINT